MAMNSMKEQECNINELRSEDLSDINDLIPDMKHPLEEKVKVFMDKAKQQPFAHVNEGYVVVVKTTGELTATDAIHDYLRKRTELLY